MDQHDPAPGTDMEWAFWRRYLRTAHILNLTILVINTVYALATWRTGPHREFLLGLDVFAALGLVAGLVFMPERTIVTSPHRDAIFASWCFAGSALTAAGVWADGGLSSPLAWLLPLSVMFTAVVHRPALVALSGGLAFGSFIGLAFLDGSVTEAPASIAVQSLYLLTLTYASIAAARYRWAHHDGQMRLHADLSRLADVDGLTGLLNHRAFHVRLRCEMATFGAYSVPMTLLLVDLDHFKSINDRFGHVTGDDMLRQAAAAIRGAVRKGDVCGRIGGEEFAVFLGPTPVGEALHIAEDIRAAVAAITEPEAITASVGVSSSNPLAPDPIVLVAQADEALYTAKRQGRNRTCSLRVA